MQKHSQKGHSYFHQFTIPLHNLRYVRTCMVYLKKWQLKFWCYAQVSYHVKFDIYDSSHLKLTYCIFAALTLIDRRKLFQIY